jgi:hypothetical protein
VITPRKKLCSLDMNFLTTFKSVMCGVWIVASFPATRAYMVPHVRLALLSFVEFLISLIHACIMVSGTINKEHD